jgi:hypothetical protein
VGKIARKSGLPGLRIIDSDLGQARDQCAVAHADAHAIAILPSLQQARDQYR